MNDYFLTVFVVSKNHENTIEKCIQSILSQKLKFQIQAIILDDNSTDKTIQLLENYKKEHNFITIHKSSNSVGQVNKLIEAYKLVNSKYVTWLDADDYWCYEYKLQTQIDFLEKNADFAGCFHDAKIVSEYNSTNDNSPQKIHYYKYYSQFNNYTPIFYPYQLLERNVIPTASLVFRNIDLKEFIKKIKKYRISAHSLNWALHLYIIKGSKFFYFNEPWSIYLDHKKGYSKLENKELFVLNNIKIFKKLIISDDYYKHYKNKIYFSIARQYEELSYNQQPINIKYGFKAQLYYFLFLKTNIWYYIQRVIKKIITF